MNAKALSPEDVALLRSSSVPTLANAIETFEVCEPNTGYSRRPLTCHFPALGMAVGVAMTARVATDAPLTGIRSPIDEREYHRFLARVEGPKLAVVADIDTPPGGAMWGEWNVNVHRALGCIGTVTEGAVRDLDAIATLRFHVFATSVSVGHGYGAFIEFGDPVDVAGLSVATGDVLVADRHGVLRIPPEIAVADLVATADRIDALETEIFEYCQSEHFDVDGLASLSDSVERRWPGRRTST